MNINKKAFSIIEIIISISIIVLLTVIGISSKKGYDENVSNTKVVSDTKTINNALSSYIQDNGTLPMPRGNINFFGADTSYVHSYDDPNTFGVYGSLTEDTIPKKYLDNLPLDPRTHSYYSYGKTKKTNEFEVASIHVINSTPIAKVIGNYTAEHGPYNLIREYNGSDFVYNGSEKNFPYNPDELILIATDKSGKIYKQGDTITVPAGQTLELYFSDGSVSVLGDTTNQTILKLTNLNFKGTDNLTTLVKLGLDAGKIWTKATKLNTNSEFIITTNDSSAAVRGTIFGVIKDINQTQTILVEGEVDILKNNVAPELINNIKVIQGEIPKKIVTSDNNTITTATQFDGALPIFTLADDIRSDDTIKTINKCNSLRIDNVCMDSENDMANEGWNLYAYAPYDKDTNMYISGGILTMNALNLNNCPLGWTGQGPICSNGTINGVYIDNDNSNGTGSLKYSGLNLNGDFAIEMSVKMPSTIPSTSKVLFYFNNTLKVYFDNKGKLYINPIIGNIDFNYYDGNFHKIIIKRESSKYSLIIDKNTTLTDITTTLNIDPILYIGSTNSYIYQYDNIINYYKIYKK